VVKGGRTKKKETRRKKGGDEAIRKEGEKVETRGTMGQDAQKLEGG